MIITRSPHGSHGICTVFHIPFDRNVKYQRFRVFSNQLRIELNGKALISFSQFSQSLLEVGS